MSLIDGTFFVQDSIHRISIFVCIIYCRDTVDVSLRPFIIMSLIYSSSLKPESNTILSSDLEADQNVTLNLIMWLYNI